MQCNENLSKLKNNKLSCSSVENDHLWLIPLNNGRTLFIDSTDSIQASKLPLVVPKVPCSLHRNTQIHRFPHLRTFKREYPVTQMSQVSVGVRRGSVQFWQHRGCERLILTATCQAMIHRWRRPLLTSLDRGWVVSRIDILWIENVVLCG